MRDATRLERASVAVQGDRAELRVEDGALTLVKDVATQSRPTTVRVGIDRVRGVTLERSTARRRGWLHLAVVDGTPAPPSEIAATSDPYTLPLTSRQVPAARRLARMIRDHVQRRGLPSDSDREPTRSTGVLLTSAPPPPQPASAGAPDDGTSGPPTSAAAEEHHTSGLPDRQEQLRQLTSLHDQGVLSDDEFARASRQVQAG